MKKYFSIIVFALLIVLSPSCSAQTESESKGGNVDVSQAKEMIAENKELQIIDRSPEEVNQGKIEGSVNINIQDEDFKAQLEKLDKDKSYLVYCHSGGRSARAMKIMKEMGFDVVYNMTGGMSSWKKSKGEIK